MCAANYPPSPACRSTDVRLRSDFWVAAYIRRCHALGLQAVLRRRGAAEAGAIFIKLDRLDGTAVVYGPAPQTEIDRDGVERRWTRVHKEPSIDAAAAEARLRREISFDSDLWIVELEDRRGRSFLDLAD